MRFAIPGFIHIVALLGSAAMSSAQSGVPVITQVADEETTVRQNARQEPARTLFLQATNSPTQYVAIGIPPRVLFNNSGTGGGFLWYESQLTGGSYTVNVTAINASGVSAPMTFHWIVHPSMLDWLRPDKPAYNVGDTITLTATYSAPVVVTGTPYLQLWGTKTARYAGGSGTSTLTFTYPIAADDPQVTAFSVTDITPADGAIATMDGVSANLHVGGFAYQQPVTFSVAGATAPVVPEPGVNPPPPPPSPTASKSDQSITFSSPVSAIVIGQPIPLGATSSAGLPITYTVLSGDATIDGNILTPTSTAPLSVRASSAGSDTVNPAFADVAFGTPQKAAQAITIATTGGSVPAEKSVTLSGTASSGLPVTYTVVNGPATVTGNTLTFTGIGTVDVRASQSGNGTYAAASDTTLTFTANPIDRLVNISSRLHVGTDAAHTAIAGFVVTGSAPKPILIRAVGPGLAGYGVQDSVTAPQLQLTDTAGNVLAANSDWNNDAQISAMGDSVGAFRLTTGSKDAAIVMTLAPGGYTAQVSSAAPGSVLIEVYDGTSNAAVPTKQLINISTRGTLDAGDSIIAGFVVSGAQSKRVLIRAVGPGLESFGVSGVLVDPVVKVYDASRTLIAQNDNWETGQTVAQMPAPATPAQIAAAGTSAGAFALKPGATDAAVVLTLGPGAYTAIVSGAAGGSGAALVEVYELNAAP